MSQPVAIDSMSDLLLLLMRANKQHSGRSSLAGITRLQKLAFLITQDPEYRSLADLGRAPHVPFYPYKMGPFTPSVYEGVEVLAEFRPPLIIISEGKDTVPQDDVELREYVEGADLDAGYPERGPIAIPTTYSLTSDGERVANYLWSNGPQELRRLVDRIVRLYAGLPLRQLLRRVYQLHPDYTTKSIIKEDLGLIG